MNKIIDVKATHGQEAAQVELGTIKLGDQVEDFNTVQARIRDNISRVGMATRHILKHSDSKFHKVGNKLVLVIEDIDGLFENEFVERFYFNENLEQKERLLTVRNRAEFLLEYWNKVKTNEIVMSYPQEMVDNMDEFLKYFAA